MREKFVFISDFIVACFLKRPPVSSVSTNDFTVEQSRHVNAECLVALVQLLTKTKSLRYFKTEN